MEWGWWGALGGLLVYAIFLYNRLVRLRHRVKNGYAQIDVQLKRRHDLIPKLVETVKAYMKHERELLAAVTEARARAVATAEHTARGGVPLGLGALVGAEAALGSALGGLLAVVENYPELKADRGLLQLQEEIATTENRIAFARQAYNDATMAYNNQREAFPDLLFTRLLAFPAAEYWALDDRAEANSPELRFED